MPPHVLRRSVSVSLGLAVSAGMLLLSPLLLAAGWAAHAFGRPKPLLAIRLVLAYCRREIGVLVGCGALWLVSAFGALLRGPRIQTLHWRLLGWFVGGITRHTVELVNLHFREDMPAEVAASLEDPAPLIVLSRHAGPGDTILLIDRLARGCARRPSVVLRASVALDPAIDLLTSRLPHAVIDSADRDESEQAIESLARGLGPGGALLLYPEGGNFTVERRRSALAHLRRTGRTRAARTASTMGHVLPPRPTGVHAALRGRPDAAVLFVAHTGLGLAAYPRQIYKELPIGGTLRTRWWRVDRDEIPTTEDGINAWLNGHWQEIDAWIDAQRTEAT